MQIIKADHDRRIEIPGAGLVRRPVDIDRTRTGFANLRSLRVYQFDQGSAIEGHAEEDEVLVVVMAGAIHFTVSEDASDVGTRAFDLSAPVDGHGGPCVVYLPPHSAYRLVPKTDTDVAYARSTPVGGRKATAFALQPREAAPGLTVLLDEMSYALRLRLRLMQINASRDEVAFVPISDSEATLEALVHVKTQPRENAVTEPSGVESWDTLVVNPGDRPTVQIAQGASALILAVLAI